MANVRNGNLFALMISTTLLLVLAILDFYFFPHYKKVLDNAEISTMTCLALSIAVVVFHIWYIKMTGRMTRRSRYMYRSIYNSEGV